MLHTPMSALDQICITVLTSVEVRSGNDSSGRSVAVLTIKLAAGQLPRKHGLLGCSSSELAPQFSAFALGHHRRSTSHTHTHTNPNTLNTSHPLMLLHNH